MPVENPSLNEGLDDIHLPGSCVSETECEGGLRMCVNLTLFPHNYVNSICQVLVGYLCRLRLQCGPHARYTVLYRAGRSICREVLKILFWEVPPADRLIL